MENQVTRLADINSGGLEYQIIKAAGPFAHINRPLYRSLYRLERYWTKLQSEITARLSYPERRGGFENAQDTAYMAVIPDPKKPKVIGAVLIFSDADFNQVGMHTLVRTLQAYQGKQVCTNLMQYSSQDWLSEGKVLTLHTESDNAAWIYTQAGYQPCYGVMPTTRDFSEKGIMMVNGSIPKETPNETYFDASAFREFYFDGTGELAVTPLTRADAAQFMLFATAYQAQFGRDSYFEANRANEPLHIPSFDDRLHWIPDARFITQFLNPHRHDKTWALKADGKLVGMRTKLHPNAKLERRMSGGVQDLTFVLQEYEHGEEELKRAS